MAVDAVMAAKARCLCERMQINPPDTRSAAQRLVMLGIGHGCSQIAAEAEFGS
jgi:hypothetical protein